MNVISQSYRGPAIDVDIDVVVMVDDGLAGGVVFDTTDVMTSPERTRLRGEMVSSIEDVTVAEDVLMGAIPGDTG